MNLPFKTNALQISSPSDLENIKKLIAEIKPYWSLKSLKFHTFKEGITNKLFAVHTETELSTDSCVLVRIFGPNTDLYIDRLHEAHYLFLLNKAGFSSEVFVKFANGICYGYTPGYVPTYEDLISPEHFHLVPEKMAALHNLPLADIANSYISKADFVIDTKPALLSQISKFINLLPNVASNGYDKNAHIYPTEYLKKDDLLREVKFLETVLVGLISPVAFCHNDLLLGNMLISPEKDAISFIDFEYCSYNHTAYDIANHFCEYAGTTNVDFSHYPSTEEQRSWLRIYLKATHSFSSIIDANDIPETLVTVWIEEIRKFTLASHLLWGIWSMVQSFRSTIDYDFESYALLRISEYVKLKKAFN